MSLYLTNNIKALGGKRFKEVAVIELHSHRVSHFATAKLSVAFVFTLAVLAFVAVWFATIAGAEPRADLNKGRALAKKLCGRCHAVDLKDASNLPKAPPFRTLAARYSVWGLQEALAEGIVVGHPAMPEFALTPQEIFHLLSYMETLAPAKQSKDQGKGASGRSK